MRGHLSSTAAIGILALFPALAQAEVNQITESYTISGVPGLIDLPTAEVANDSELAFSYSQYGPNARGTMTFQVTERLSASFRYSKLADFSPKTGDYFDRSFDLRYRVLNESKYLPAVSIGLNDFIGTGIYSSEYIVATKSFLDNRLRVTGGLGWGRLGSSNAIGNTGDRPAWDYGVGGTLSAGQWFKGDFAPFGGLSYKVNDRLTVKAEYSPDIYVQEVRTGIMEHSSPFNFGLDYKVSDTVNLGAFYLHGETIGAQVTMRFNPRKPTSFSGNEAAPLPVRPRPSRSSDPAAWATDWVTDADNHTGIQTALAKQLKKDGIRLESMALSAGKAELRIRNLRYFSSPQAVGRVARVMTRAMPASVETFVVTLVEQGMPLSSVTLRRSDIERLENAPAPEIFQHAQIHEADISNAGHVVTPGLYPKFHWSLAPYTRMSLFDPTSPIRGEIGVRASARYEIVPGVVFAGSVTKAVVGNLDDAGDPSYSALPPVRSHAALYAKEGDPSIETLTAAWYARPTKNIYSRVTVGYLERMFGGISGEIIWKPVDSRLALGAEVAWVAQRDYDQMFGFQDYNTVTGHISAYYDLGNGFVTQVDAGKYLAGDWGATVAFDRKFANGWSIGAYATKTNVSAKDFGEGSFDKGIRISIPLDWAIGTPTRTTSTTTLRSLSRDGGARLKVDGRLFEWIEGGHGDALSNRWGKFWR